MATYAGNLKRFNGTDWDILLPNPASHDTDYTDIVYPTYTTTTAASEAWYRIATIPLSATKRNLQVRVRATTTSGSYIGTETDSVMYIQFPYKASQAGSSHVAISSTNGHSYDSWSGGEQGYVLLYARVSYDATNAYLDVYKYKSVTAQIETTPLIDSEWTFSTGALTANPTIGSVRNRQIDLRSGLTASGGYISASGSSDYCNYGVLGGNTGFNHAIDYTNYWAYIGYIVLDYNGSYLEGRSGQYDIKFQELSIDGSKTPANLEDFMAKIKVNLATHTNATTFNTTVPTIAIELEGNTARGSSDFAVYTYSTNTSQKILRVYIKLLEPQQFYQIYTLNRYGRSFDSGTANTTSYAGYWVYRTSEVPVASLPAAAQGSFVYATKYLPQPASHTQDLGTITTSAAAGNIIISSGSVLTHTVGLSASKITADVLNTARLGSGAASSSTWLRGDGTWAALPGDNNNYLTSISNTTSGTSQLLTFSRNGLTDLTTTILSATETRAGLITTGAQTIAGDKSFTGLTSFNTSSGTTPLRITRTGATSEAASMYLDDGKFYQSYFNDENASAIRFILNNTDTETGGGAQANSGYVEITQGTTGTALNINGNNVALANHTHNIGDVSASTATAGDIVIVASDKKLTFTNGLSASKITVDTLATARLGSGTASSSTWLRGDQTWQTLPVDPNWYPTAFSWSNGTTLGPTGSLTGTGMSAISFGAIPAASSSQSGIITTGSQTIAGNKSFGNGIILSGYDNYLNFGANAGMFLNSAANELTIENSNGPIDLNTPSSVRLNGVNVATVNDVALKAPIASPTFTTAGTDFAIGDVSNKNRIQSYSTGVPIRFLNSSNGFSDISVNDVYLGGSSSLNTALSGKQATITGAATTIASSNLTASRILISDGSGKVATSAYSSLKLNDLDRIPASGTLATQQWVAEMYDSGDPVYNRLTMTENVGYLSAGYISVTYITITVYNMSNVTFDRIYAGLSPNPTDLWSLGTDGLANMQAKYFDTRYSPGIGTVTGGSVFSVYVRGYNIASNTYYNYNPILLRTRYAGNRIMASVASSNDLSELDTQTYPNLTELSRLKGVTSPIQTSISTLNNRTMTMTVPSYGVAGGSIVLSFSKLFKTGLSNGEFQYIYTGRVEINSAAGGASITLPTTITNATACVSISGTSSSGSGNDTAYVFIASTASTFAITHDYVTTTNSKTVSFIVIGSAAS